MCIRDSFWVELMYYLGFDAFRQVALQFHDKPYDNGKLSDDKKWEWVMNCLLYTSRCV